MEPRAFLLLLELFMLVTTHGLEAPAGLGSLLLSSPAPEKAGRCPLGRDRDVPPSKRFCLSDASCPGSEKCCNVGTVRICVQPATVGAGYCPLLCSAVEEPCLVTCLDDTWCGPGEKCCRNGCHICCVVAEPAKPGVCPRKRVSLTSSPCANQCLDDRSCPADKKCCFTGCGLECVSPSAEQPLSCPLDRSQPADKLGSEAKQCSGEDCSQGPVEASLVKPGACPVLLRGSLGPCTEVALKNCSDDFDCEEAKKCCWTGCRYDCAVPDEVHPGTCPPRAAENSTALCVAFCVRDNDCPKSQKCCWLSCGRSCTAPDPGLPAMEPPQRKAKKKPEVPSEEKLVDRIPTAKVGQCEIPADRCLGTITYECKTDSECSGTTRCCLEGCSQKCVSPPKDTSF